MFVVFLPQFLGVIVALVFVVLSLLLLFAFLHVVLLLCVSCMTYAVCVAVAAKPTWRHTSPSKRETRLCSQTATLSGVRCLLMFSVSLPSLLRVRCCLLFASVNLSCCSLLLRVLVQVLTLTGAPASPSKSPCWLTQVRATCVLRAGLLVCTVFFVAPCLIAV